MSRVIIENVGKEYKIQGPKDRTIKSSVLDVLLTGIVTASPNASVNIIPLHQ